MRRMIAMQWIGRWAEKGWIRAVALVLFLLCAGGTLLGCHAGFDFDALGGG